MLKHSRAHNNHILTEMQRIQILNRISLLGPHGTKTREYLESAEDRLQSLYGTRRWRLRLIRHVVTLFLFNEVFEPFALGISQEFSDGLKFIDMNVNRQGMTFRNTRVDDAEPKFANVLMIHQAMGHNILHLTQEKMENCQVQLTGELAEVLQLLLPLTAEGAIASLAKRIVEKAIPLKTAMTDEYSLFHCFMADCGDNFNEQPFEVDDERPTGRVVLCTFPGLARTIKKDSQKLEVIVAKGRASLDMAT